MRRIYNSRLEYTALYRETVPILLQNKICLFQSAMSMDNHSAIVPRDIYNRVQEEFARRNSKISPSTKSPTVNKGRFSSKYALTELLRCGACGAAYRRVTWPAKEKGGEKRIVWRCIPFYFRCDIAYADLPVRQFRLLAEIHHGQQHNGEFPIRNEICGRCTDV